MLALWPERIAGLDDVPTALELGSEFEGLQQVRALVMRKSTPQFLVVDVQNAFRQAFGTEEFQASLEESFLNLVEYPVGSDADFLRKLVREYEDLLAEEGVSPGP